MIYNYHTHTARCHHASGTPEEYIIRAVENGIKYLGFSDHIPFAFPDGYEANYRVRVCEGEDYICELRELREKYKDIIDIKIGFEMEYYPTYFKDMLNDAIKFGGEYLILGQHFLGEEYPDGTASVLPTNSVEDIQEYTELVVEGIKSGVFSYVAHPDVLNYMGDVEAYRKEMRKICIAARKYNIPLEVNFLGIRTNRHYPNEAFWEIAGEEKSPVTFGFDAHDVEAAYDGESLKKAKQLVEKYNLNYVGVPELKLIQKMNVE